MDLTNQHVSKIPSPPGSPRLSNNDHEVASTGDTDHISNISTLTADNDDLTTTSRLAHISSKLTSVLHDAALLLTGQNPNEEDEEEVDFVFVTGGNSDQQTKPTGSAAFLRSPSFSKRHLPTQHEDHTAESEEDTERNTDTIDFLNDAPREMTWSRRIALHCSRRYGWYNPQLNKKQAEGEQQEEETTQEAMDDAAYNDAYPFTHSKRQDPNVEKGWAYWEHVALARYVVRPKANTAKKNILRRVINKFRKANKSLDRAEPGENNRRTALYHPLFTPHKQLGDFGLGFGLYFSTLRALALLTLIAGLLNIPNLLYFSSEEYSGGQQGLTLLLKGSAICTNTTWVPCPDCSPDDFLPYRLATGSTPEGNAVTFALLNNCNGATLQQGFVNYATLFFIIFGIFIHNQYLNHMEVAFDEDEQTAQDYSIVIRNPPGDATDPEEWRKFFFDSFNGAHATACTIAVDNDLLVKSLVERRELLRKIEMLVEPGTSLDTLTLTAIAAKEEQGRRFLGKVMALISPGVPELFGKLIVLNAKVQGLAQQDRPATQVFVTFETEAAQRRVLSALTVGAIAVHRNNTAAVADRKYLFRGERVLKVDEPEEPNTVRWQDLNETLKDRARQQLLTAAATAVSVVVLAIVVEICHQQSIVFSAFAISIFNTVFPMFAKFLTSLEAHASEGGKQRSLYLKIALFRWVNTAVVITMIYPFADTLSNDGGLIPQIYALFFAEIVTTNVIQLLDPVGHLQRHFLAPRSSTQDAMNLNFSGQVVELAERYTNMTKILFLTVWYSAIYPSAFLLCAMALFINYFVDRFSLMRTWKRAPHLGPRISTFSRRYFFSLAIVAMAVLSSYYWSGFPYDNLCKNDGTVGSHTGTWTVSPLDSSEPVPVTVSSTQPSFRYCVQDFFRLPGRERGFPFVPKKQPAGDEWMTEEQEVVTGIYGWTAVGVMSTAALLFLIRFYLSIRGMFHGTYEACGEDQNIPFSEVPSISTYVPQVESTVFSYPLIACNVDNIDPGLFDWTDPDRPHSFYDLTKDAKVLIRGSDVSSKVVFSSLTHWPPPKKQSLGDEVAM